MKKSIYLFAHILIFSLVIGCSYTAEISHYSEEAYKLEPSVHIQGKLAVFAMMSAGSSSLKNTPDSKRFVDTGSIASHEVTTFGVTIPSDNSIEGFRNQANNILLARLNKAKNHLAIMPPKQAQGLINQANLTLPYLNFLQNYKYLSASPDFLQKLGNTLNCKYLLIPQLVVISNSNDNAIYIAAAFGKKYADYSVSIIGQVWDLSTGELVWSGRGTSYTLVKNYKNLATFDQLATNAAEALINRIPF